VSFVSWRALRAVVLAGLVGLIALAIDACADGPLRAGDAGKYFTIPDADVQVRLNDDASLSVVENLNFDFHGDFRGAYRDIPLQGGAEITHIRVSEGETVYEPGANTTLGSFDRAGSFGTTDFPGSFETPQGLRVVWHYNAGNEERVFTIAYKVENAAIAYDDVIDVGWFVWGDQWDFWLDDLSAGMSAESGVPPTDGWVEPRRRGIQPSIGETTAGVEIRDLPQGEPTLLRAVFPRSAVDSVDGAQVRSGEGLPAILAEEEQLDDDYSLFEKARNFVTNNILLLCGLWTALILLAAATLYWRARDLPTSVGEHLAEPPEDIPPALAYAYATEGEYDDKVVLATLLRAIDRGYYDAKATSGAGDDDLDLELSVAAERPAGELENYEVATIDFFDKLLGDKTVAMSKLKDEIPKHSSTWRSRWEDLNDSLNTAEEGKIGWDRDLTGARALLTLIAFLGYAAILFFYFVRTHDYVVPLTAMALGMFGIYALPSTWLKRLDAPSRERNAQWSAFSKWTEDFPRLKDDPPATLKLWRDVLVYAVAFGTAEKVLESGRIPESVFGEASSSGIGWVYVGSHSNFSSDMNGFSGGFSSQVAPESSSGSGGGGGFSGGGGGSSGGGGGGAW